MCVGGRGGYIHTCRSYERGAKAGNSGGEEERA